MITKRHFFALIVCLFMGGIASAQTYRFTNPNLSERERLNDLISRLTIDEKLALLRHNQPAISRLNIPKYYFGNEALHGVVRPGKFTVFPQAIGLGSMWEHRFDASGGHSHQR